ncbi:CGLAU_01105 family protein [Corynebacterium aquatimens]|uniref:Uncharacterized protein n=1 Tax=Corynebacterium aquatimens TaxID=1190508 RepID=A0A931E4U6_9CORY|nr:CGLAU_01105 family protein [Corynebacterium aquatimens]MBG6122478.1 hypothetical protein [Corynebacterium aquatimens]WJY64982.1 hypothetical protein CAQUA_01215 [Corynebacterium aquatimens]
MTDATSHNSENNRDNNADNNRENNTDNNELLDALKGVGGASAEAIARIGDVLGDFGRKLKEDRESANTGGSHHAEDSVVEDHDGVISQLKAAVDNARAAYQGAENDNDVRAAGASFVNDADSILRDLAGSVTRAAYSTGESTEADEAKKALRSALEEARDGIQSAMNKFWPSSSEGESVGKTDGETEPGNAAEKKEDNS